MTQEIMNLLVMLLNLSHYTISLKVVTNIGAYLFLLVVGLGRNVETRCDTPSWNYKEI